MAEIYKITVEQSQLLTPEKSSDLLVIIERKQEHINSINKINEELLPLEEKIINCTVRSGGKEAKKIYDEKLEEIRILREKEISMAEKIQKLDGQNFQMINGEFQKLKSDIKKLKLKKGTFKAYRGSTVQTYGCFIDNKK
jgi:hypothetical protein